MACAGPGVAAHQDVPVQADLHQQCARADQLADGRRGHSRPDEAVARTAAGQMGQPSAGEGQGVYYILQFLCSILNMTPLTIDIYENSFMR